MKKTITILLICAMMIAFEGCSQKATENKAESSTNSTIVSNEKKAEYHKMSAQEAKKMIDENSNIILLDVRTETEFKEKRIDGAILIPDYEIGDRAEKELPDKNAIILIYCRSGNRSKTAANVLVSMGYVNVYDFGGINNYPYDTVSE